MVAAAVTLGGVQLPATLRVEGHELDIASCGVRNTLWINHYAAALYVPTGKTPQAVSDPSSPKAVMMKVIDAWSLPPEIPAKWRGVLEEELAREPMQRVRRAYRNLDRGDVVLVTYLPGKGVTMSIDGHEVASGLGQESIDDILKAWAGPDPISGKLRRLTLKHPC